MTNDIFIDSYKRNNHLGFPLDSNIYLEKNYINPITKNDLDNLRKIDEKAYEKYYRSIRNNITKSNKLNLYNPVMKTTNKYQEMDFPIQDIKIDLEEYTDEYVFDDEKVYLYTKANEYIPDKVTTPSVYMSSYLTHGGMTFGTMSEISPSEEFEVWDIMSSGDFFITDRQIIIFEKGRRSFVRQFLFAGDNFKRNVISIPLSDIELVIGDEKDGVLQIYRKYGRRHNFNKSDSNRKKYRFSNGELRYMVNLLASLINNETKETLATSEANVASEKYLLYSMGGCKYSIPERWTEKVDSETEKSYHSKNVLLKVNNELNGSIDMTIQGFIDGLYSTTQKFELLSKSEIVIADTTAYRHEMNFILSGKEWNGSLVTFYYNNGIIIFFMATPKESYKDYGNKFENILSSIKLTDEP